VPHGQSAHFGGDPDNFCYPRWGLDFSFLRAYQGGQPADTKKVCFSWKTEGAKEGELVFVTGNPGQTGRLQTFAQCEFMRDHVYPQQLVTIHAQLETMYAQAKESAAKEKELRAKILGLENRRKAFQGYLDGLKNPRIMAIKQKAESDLRAAVAKNPELQQRYGDAWDAIASLQKAKVEALADKAKSDELAKEEQAQNKRIGEACFAVYGTSIPPDATMSLRLSDGLVKGYPMNGTLAPPITTLYGLFAALRVQRRASVRPAAGVARQGEAARPQDAVQLRRDLRHHRRQLGLADDRQGAERRRPDLRRQHRDARQQLRVRRRDLAHGLGAPGDHHRVAAQGVWRGQARRRARAQGSEGHERRRQDREDPEGVVGQVIAVPVSRC
jgi:hypothetical protein